METEATIRNLAEIEAVKRLKYRYARLLDQKRWEELAELFTPDVRVAYADGKYSYEGREAVMGFLQGAMSAPALLSGHQIGQPEIDLLSESTARGVWKLDDVIVQRDAGYMVWGAGYYEDEYVKVDGEWRIRFTGYSRIYEFLEPLHDPAKREITHPPRPQ